VFKTRYRIVLRQDGYYQLEVRHWFWPFWVRDAYYTYADTVESLEQYVSKLKFKPRVIKEL